MSFTRICDHCHQQIDRKQDVVSVEYRKDGKYITKDYHIDCFNYKFSCDIRK